MPEATEELGLRVGREAHGQGEQRPQHVNNPHDYCSRMSRSSVSYFMARFTAMSGATLIYDGKPPLPLTPFIPPPSLATLPEDEPRGPGPSVGPPYLTHLTPTTQQSRTRRARVGSVRRSCVSGSGRVAVRCPLKQQPACEDRTCVTVDARAPCHAQHIPRAGSRCSAVTSR